jgi:hypothetical protein
MMRYDHYLYIIVYEGRRRAVHHSSLSSIRRRRRFEKRKRRSRTGTVPYCTSTVPGARYTALSLRLSSVVS